MAIDTAAERRSTTGILPWHGPGVTPDATPDDDWREAAGHTFTGLTYRTNPIGSVPSDIVINIAGPCVIRITGT